MAQTTRIGPADYASPYLRFYMGADWIGQDWAGNYSILRTSITNETAPGGSTATNQGGWGTHYIWWGGGRLQTHEGNPFAPSGYSVGSRRWDEAADHVFYHDADGYLSGGVAFGMHVEYSGVNNDFYGSIAAPARIPKRPSPPTSVAAIALSPTSIRVSFANPVDTGGGILDLFRARISTTNPPWTGSYTDKTSGTTPIDFTGLTPGLTYYVAVYVHNNAADNGGWSNPSSVVTIGTPSGAYVSNGTSWIGAEILESDGTTWNSRRIQVSNGTIWQDAL